MLSDGNNNKSKVKNSIEYIGLAKKLPNNPTTFKQFILNDNFCIPPQKLDMEAVIKVEAKVEIENYKFIKTPVATSIEHQKLTGTKLVVYGSINYRLMYAENGNTQSVHSVHFKKKFCEFIVVKNNIKPCTAIKIIPYIENIDVCIHDERCMGICSMVFLDVRVCVDCDSKSKNGCSGLCAKPIGIADKLPTSPMYFKELVLEEVLEIPELKPDIEDLISIASEVEIISSRIINTESKTSLEGQNLSGCKLVLELKQRDRIVYTANIEEQSLHSSYYESGLKSAFVIIPCQINGIDTDTLLEECKLKITPYIEDVCAMKEDLRTIRKYLVLLIDVVTKCI